MYVHISIFLLNINPFPSYIVEDFEKSVRKLIENVPRIGVTRIVSK